MLNLPKILVIVCMLPCISIAADVKDSLENVLKTTKTDTVRASAYQSLGNYLIRTDKQGARHNYLQAIELYNKLKQHQKKADIFNAIGISYAMQGNQDSAIHFVKKSLEIHEEYADTMKMAFAYNNLGLMHSDCNRYNESMEYLLKSLEYKKKLLKTFPAEKLDIASTELNIGIAFHYILDLPNALRYYQMAKKSYRDANKDYGVANVNLQIANLYLDKKDYAKADSIYNRLLEQKIFDTNPHALAKLYNNYGELLLNTKNYRKARIVIQDALALNKEQGNTQSAVLNLMRLGKVEYALNNYSEAIAIGTEAYETAKKNNQTLGEKHAADLLAQSYEKTGDFKQSLSYLKIFHMLNDSLYNVERNMLMTELEAKYQTTEKENKILLQEAKLDKQKRLIYTYAMLLAAFVMFSIFLYYISVLRKKHNRKLRQVISTKDKLISIIAHDLKNPAIAQKIAIEQMLKNAEAMKNPELSRSLSALFRSSESQVSLLLNLLNWAHTQTGCLEIKPVKLNLTEVLEKNIELFSTTAKNKKINIRLNTDKNCLVYADHSTIDTVIRNLISNALKFSFPEKEIEISCTNPDTGTVTCRIKDTGTGMSQTKVRNLFDPDKRELSKGTSGEEGSGLGLYLCKDMIEKNRGKLQIKSAENEGTEVSFSLPVNQNT